MQLDHSFYGLLVGLLVLIFVQDTKAIPIAQRMVTLPLTPVELSRPDIHPQVVSRSSTTLNIIAYYHSHVVKLLQLHMNRGVRRLAHMTGREEPSVEELRNNLSRRILSIEETVPVSKRFNRIGTNPKVSTGSAGVNAIAKVNVLLEMPVTSCTHDTSLSMPS